MDQILAAVTSLLVAVLSVTLALAVVPLLCKLLLPAGGDAVWRGYWRLVRWTLTAPFKACAMLIRHRGERR